MQVFSFKQTMLHIIPDYILSQHTWWLCQELWPPGVLTVSVVQGYHIKFYWSNYEEIKQ